MQVLDEEEMIALDEFNKLEARLAKEAERTAKPECVPRSVMAPLTRSMSQYMSA